MMEFKNVVTKKEIRKMLWRSSFLQTGYNYERRQANGWLYCMLPGLLKIYENEPEEMIEVAKNHVTYIGTHPFLVTFVQGVIISMEETRQDRELINSLKISLMSPLGGVGDALIWMTLLPITAGIGASIAMGGSIMGPIIFFVAFNAVHIFLRLFLMDYGYRLGAGAAVTLKTSTKKISRAASIVGMMVVGSLIPTYVKFSLPLTLDVGNEIFNLQTDLFDKIMPGLLPILLTYFCYYLLTKKKATTMKLIYLCIVIGLLGGLLGIYKYVPFTF